MQKRFIRNVLGLGGFILTLSMILAACGDSIVSTTTTSPVATTATTSSATTVAATTARPITAASATIVATTIAATIAPVTNTSIPTTVATTAPAITTAAATTVAANPTPAPTGVAAFLYYTKRQTKGADLISIRPGGGSQHTIATNVFKPTIIRDNQVVYYQEVPNGADTVVQLKMAVETISGTFKETVLDSQAIVPLPAADRIDGDPYGESLERQTSLDISPDGTTITYTKSNPAAPTFEGIHYKNRPTELWVANLNPQNPSPKKLVPNDKDFISKPIWSSDGNRVAFLRTDNFGTGAGYFTALWSVFKDGTRLAFLTGPKLTKAENQRAIAAPAVNLVWVGPQALSFQGNNQINKPVWLHDLSQASDYPRSLVPDSGNAFYCSQLRRYVYVRQDLQPNDSIGVYSVEVDKPGTNNGPPLPSPIDEAATQILGCEGNAVLYLDGKGQVTVQRLNPDGGLNGAKLGLGAAIGGDLSSFQNQGVAALSPGGRFVVVTGKANKGVSVFKADGTAVAVTNAPASLEQTTIQWQTEQLAVITSNTALVEVDLSQPNPAVRQIDSAPNLGVLTFISPRRPLP